MQSGFVGETKLDHAQRINKSTTRSACALGGKTICPPLIESAKVNPDALMPGDHEPFGDHSCDRTPGVVSIHDDGLGPGDCRFHICLVLRYLGNLKVHRSLDVGFGILRLGPRIDKLRILRPMESPNLGEFDVDQVAVAHFV